MTQGIFYKAVPSTVKLTINMYQTNLGGRPNELTVQDEQKRTCQCEEHTIVVPKMTQTSFRVTAFHKVDPRFRSTRLPSMA